jgi:hypothetical protein
MRSFKEVSFRLRQEGANALLYLAPPQLELRATTPLETFPSGSEVADALRGTGYERDLLQLAEQIMGGRIPVLGMEIDYGRSVAWRRDPVSRIETPAKYFRRVAYLDPAAAGDHKLIWEINRHQHLVLLAQAFVLSGRTEYIEEVFRQLEGWWTENPFQRGINWASALEVGFRALSWVWIWHLGGDKMPAAFRKRFLTELYRHGLHLQYNLSVYFSPNTHLLGEAIALHALGCMFPEWQRAKRWRRLGNKVVRQHMSYAVKADGSYFEQSAYYHVYALDMFLFHALLEEPDAAYREGLLRMSEFLAGIVNASGDLPQLGDEDGGRLFHPFGNRMRFGRGTLATASLMLNRGFFAYDDRDVQEVALWWLGPEKCRAQPTVEQMPQSGSFNDSGLVVMRGGEVCAVFDAGAFGPWSGGHSHSDTLSLIVWRGEQEVLIDAGTYSYMDPQWRETFRSSAAHNTVRIDGRDQATAAGPFRWNNKPKVQLLEFIHDAELDCASAVCSYGGFTHKRTIEFHQGGEFRFVDELGGPAGEHLVEQFWHLGVEAEQTGPGVWLMGDVAELTVEGGEMEQGWRCRVYGSKEIAPVIVVRRRTTLPMTMHARLRLL